MSIFYSLTWKLRDVLPFHFFFRICSMFFDFNDSLCIKYLEIGRRTKKMYKEVKDMRGMRGTLHLPEVGHYWKTV